MLASTARPEGFRLIAVEDTRLGRGRSHSGRRGVLRGSGEGVRGDWAVQGTARGGYQGGNVRGVCPGLKIVQS
jgi:hypothetical protein